MELRVKILSTILALLLTVLLCCSSVSGAEADKDKVFEFTFYVDDDGGTSVVVSFYDVAIGSSWLLIPRGQEGNVSVAVHRGKLVNISYESLIEDGRESPFYVNMTFTYEGEDYVNLSIKYFMAYGSLIIEPKAMFVSPRVKCGGKDFIKTMTLLPGYAITSRSDVSSFSGSIKDVEVSAFNGFVIVEASVRSDDRVVIRYEVPSKPSMVNISLGNLVFRTPSRYSGFAQQVLEVLNESYAICREVFGIDLKDVEVVFFVPSMPDLAMGLMGYVPFMADKLGAVHLNLLYIRGVEGFLHIVALHEIIHHFMWAIGVPPLKLWIHEGVAQYLSLTIGRLLGYEGAVDMHERGLVLAWRVLGDELGFIQRWTPFYTPPQGLGHCYAASYKIFKELCDRYGGLEYLKILLRELRRVDWSNETQVIEAFGLAAGNVNDVFVSFHRWGFEFKTPLQASIIIAKVKGDVSRMPEWLEPHKSLAQVLIRVAELLQKNEASYRATILAEVARSIYELSPYTFVVSLAMVVLAIVVSRHA
ncbi:MAG: hypothetical protein N3F04_05960 [Candidatus Nezhaarchaeota archaeon]|nr:hypothetical protein [Candidatus Nezhaarchaeota archaeon]MCX8142285.1 hypothetical protein [Candidatus Nezhaarchaeota archaeon]MDW8050742.1 hypothetical protein [Nitrososphaerota archaeon]